jgi:methylmalonyl-CoA epimerase
MIRLNHIGIAVADLPALTRLFGILGLEVNHIEPVPEQGVRTHFLPIQPDASGSHLEFLEVLDPQGTVAQFIQKRGPGIHHLSFTVPKGNLDALCRRLKEEGYRLIYEQPKAGAHQMRINFIHPASAGGMLIEIMEPQS